MRTFAPFFWLLLIFPLSVGGQSPTTNVQSAAVIHQLKLPLGSVFEMIVDHDIEDPTYNWSFSKENIFLQAGRTDAFRVRLVENGSYFLTAEIRNKANTENYKKRFNILVSDSAPILKNTGLADSILSTTVPIRDAKQRLVLHGGIEVLTLVPRQNTDKAIRMDMNDAIDSDGDGKATNDQDVEKTFFSTKKTPLHIWLTTPGKAKSYTLSLEGEIHQEILPILTPVQAAKIDRAEQKSTLENDDLVITPFSSGAIKFHVQLEEKDYKSAPLLLHWKFGDGTQSMLDSPIHVYTKNGIFSVSVDVLNLRTGEVVDTLVNIARVSSIVPKQPDTKITDPTIPEEEQEEEKPSFLSLGLLVKFLLGILGSAIFGFIIVMVIKLVKGKGGLAGALDKAESTLVKSDEDKSNIIDTPEPMALPDTEEEAEEKIIDIPSEPVEAPLEPESESAPEAKAEAPPAQQEPAETPSWLQGGMEKATATGQTIESAPPETLQDPTPPPEKLPNEDAAPIESAPTSSDSEGDTPAWLDSPEAVTEPAKNVDAPDWLQNGMTQAAKEGQTIASPPPPELQDTPQAKPTAAPTASGSADGSIPQDIWGKMTPEEKELEKKRQKRRRYRQNKKARARQEKEQGKDKDETLDTTAPASAVEPQPVPEADDNEIKFVVGADSINDQASGEIPLEKPEQSDSEDKV